MLKTDDVTQPPPTSVKPDIGNTIQTLKEGIDIMGKKEMERANQSEEDEEKHKIEGDEVELRKSEPGEGKRCRVLFRYKLILIMCDQDFECRNILPKCINIPSLVTSRHMMMNWT